MYIDGIPYPGRGYTILAKAGERLVCGSPSDIFRIDAWGEPAENVFDGVRELFGLTVAGENVYWLEQHDEEPMSLGVVPLDGGEARIVSQNGRYSKLLHAESTGKLIWAGHLGLRAFDLRAAELRALELGDVAVQDIALDDEYVYATIWGYAPQTTNGKPDKTQANWIVRVPLEEIP
jgi:hypothetical protein